MSLDLDTWQPPRPNKPAGVELREAIDELHLGAYEDLVLSYWELDEADREHIRRLNRHLFHQRVHSRRWLAYIDGAPVGKGYLSLAGPPGVAAIFGMSVRPDARGHGIAGALTHTLIEQARTLECHKVVLHASDMAIGLYRRAGFAPRCTLTFYATAPLWSTTH
jgi:ribosomal protein S18 acetylase RimI-like enzyme